MKLFNHIFRHILACGGIIALMSSCSDLFEENTVCPDDPAGDAGEAYFMSIRVFQTDDAESRAAFDSNSDNTSDNLFNKGLHAERAIYPHSLIYTKSPHFMVLFKADGTKVGDFLWLSQYSTAQSSETDPLYTSYTTLYAATKDDDVVKANLAGGKVLVVLNANENLQQKLNTKTTYQDFLKIKEGDPTETTSDFLYLIDDKGTRYFTMSSSMVIDTNNNVVPANLGTIQWYQTEQQALANPYNMYVERLQAKYTVLFQKDGSLHYFGSPDSIDQTKYKAVGQYEALYFDKTDPKRSLAFKKLRYVKEYIRSRSISEQRQVDVQETEDWKVNITGWGINGTQKREYLFKQLTPTDPVYSNGTWWDTPYYPYRNYWAEGVDYDNVTYPDQYRPATDERRPDKTNVSVTGYAQGDTTKFLNYFPYSQLRKREPHQYSSEHTFKASIFANGTKALESKEYLRASTHLIVGAQLLIGGLDDVNVYNSTKINNNSNVIKPNTPVTETTEVVCKVYMDGIYWAEDAYKDYVVENLGYWLLTDENQKVERFGRNDGNFYTGISPDPSNKYLMDRDAVESVAVNIEGGDGYIRLSLRPNFKAYIYDPDKVILDEVTKVDITTEADKYTEVPREKFEALVLEHPEYFGAHFYFGRMYYAIPIKHNTSSASSNTIATGDFGAVRNHWYSFTIDGVFSPGVSVADPAQKIIPNNEPIYETLSVNMNILRWHEVSTDVDISDQLPNQPK